MRKNVLWYAWTKSRTSSWGDARESLPMIPGSDRKTDSEYVRSGTVSIFAFVEPLGGMHHVSVREHRTAVDWAEEIKYLVDVMYPDAEKIILVMDDLNTHKVSSLYKRYPPEEARRIIKKLEIHYTPKHGSWLDIAEIELNVMTRQCLSHRIAVEILPSIGTLYYRSQLVDTLERVLKIIHATRTPRFSVDLPRILSA